jgi:uncharacterized protein YndB with AHSA1/START domain
MHSLEQLLKRWGMGALLVLALLAVTAVVAGMLLPAEHEVARRLTLSRSPDVVWRALTDSVRIRTWRTESVALERMPDSAGHAGWRERLADGRTRDVRVLEEQAPVHRRIRMSEGDGRMTEWEMVIARHPSGITLTVRERGTIRSRSGRFVSQFTTGHAGPLETWMAMLAGYFDEPPRIGLRTRE